jgi:hypothetical protein
VRCGVVHLELTHEKLIKDKVGSQSIVLSPNAKTQAGRWREIAGPNLSLRAFSV